MQTFIVETADNNNDTLYLVLNASGETIDSNYFRIELELAFYNGSHPVNA